MKVGSPEYFESLIDDVRAGKLFQGATIAWLVQHIREQKAQLVAPVAGDRLRASLACHIDHDEPPGLAANDIAGTVLALLDGCRNDGSAAFRLHRELLDLADRYRKETT